MSGPKVSSVRGATVIAPRTFGGETPPGNQMPGEDSVQNKVSKNDVLWVAEGRFGNPNASLGHFAGQQLDRDDMFVLPGFIDLHVHFNEPGRSEWEGIERGSIKGVVGGTTTVVDMPIDSDPPTIGGLEVAEKCRLFGDKSFVNYGVLAGAVPGRLSEMVAAAQAGAVGFKSFLSPSGWDDFRPLDSKTLEVALTYAARLGLRLAVHAEDPALFDPSGIGEAARPIESELGAVALVLSLASKIGAKVHLVHLSSAEAVRMVAQFPNATAETCPHYFLSDPLLERFSFAGVDVAPPVRVSLERTELRALVARGSLDAIASDHSPGPPEVIAGSSPWAGTTGVGRTLLSLLDEFDSPALVAAYVASAAGVFGFANKGAISQGYDADFVVVQRMGKRRWQIVDVVVSGDLVVREGELLARPAVVNLAPSRTTAHRITSDVSLRQN